MCERRELEAKERAARAARASAANAENNNAMLASPNGQHGGHGGHGRMHLAGAGGRAPDHFHQQWGGFEIANTAVKQHPGGRGRRPRPQVHQPFAQQQNAGPAFRPKQARAPAVGLSTGRTQRSRLGGGFGITPKVARQKARPLRQRPDPYAEATGPTDPWNVGRKDKIFIKKTNASSNANTLAGGVGMCAEHPQAPRRSFRNHGGMSTAIW